MLVYNIIYARHIWWAIRDGYGTVPVPRAWRGGAGRGGGGGPENSRWGAKRGKTLPGPGDMCDGDRARPDGVLRRATANPAQDEALIVVIVGRGRPSGCLLPDPKTIRLRYTPLILYDRCASEPTAGALYIVLYRNTPKHV